MNRIRSFLLIWGLMVIASLLIACASVAEPAAPTAAPTATPEPPTATPIPTAVLVPATSGEVPRITPQELNDRLDNGEDILVIDTRGKSSYDVRHIAGAVVARANYDDIARDQEIVLYCA